MNMKISDIKVNPQNPRTIKDENFKKLVQSLKDFPEMLEAREIVVNKDHIILGGNMRFKAAVEAGYTEVPVKVVDWSEDKQRQFIIKDNVSGGDWDWDILANEWDLQQLDDWGLQLPEDIKPEGEVEEDEAPEVSSEPPVSKLGEIYQLGRHRVMCGDSTDKASVELLMNGEEADMVLTDPPYGMFLNADFSGMVNKLDFAKKKGFKSGRKYDNVQGDHEDFNPDCINVVFENFNCKEVFLWGANYYSELLPDRNEGSWIVWDKRLEDSADKMYGSCFELCWSKQKHKQDIARIKWVSVFGTEQEFDKKRHHPTQKPIGLSAWFIEKYSKEEWTIADVFLGSGSTLIACEQTDRTCYGMELDEKYLDVIRKRWAKYVYPDRWEKEWEILTPAIAK